MGILKIGMQRYNILKYFSIKPPYNINNFSQISLKAMPLLLNRLSPKKWFILAKPLSSLQFYENIRQNRGYYCRSSPIKSAENNSRFCPYHVGASQGAYVFGFKGQGK